MAFLPNSVCASMTLPLAFVAMEIYVLAKYVGIDSSEHTVQTGCRSQLKQYTMLDVYCVINRDCW